MTHIRSVMAATDFSPDSRHAAERAAMLGTTLTMQRGLLLHVLEQSWLDSLKQFISAPTEVKDGIIDDASRSLRKLAEETRLLSGFSLEPQVLTGNTLDVIVESASHYDLLVLGARGRHPVRALALGTTSQRLLSKIRKSVLVVKRKPDTPYQRILVAVDFSPNSRKAIEYGFVIAPGALVNIVHVFEPLFEKQMISAGASDKIIEDYRAKARIDAENQMSAFLATARVGTDKALQSIEHGHASARLPEIVERWDPDLIIVGKHGRSRIEELLLGSVTIHMLAQSQCDVLIAQ